MYVELHARSAFSFLEGACLPEEIAAMCAQQNIPAAALLDRDGVYGSPRFHLAAEKSRIRAHVGAEVTSVEGFRYPLLVASRIGYQNLCRLITRMKLRAAKGEGSVSSAEIADHAKDLICLTGGDEGPLACSLQQNGFDAAATHVRKLVEIFGRDNVYVELQRHFSREEESRNQAALEIAHKLHLPILATNGPCQAVPVQREILDVFTCIRHHCTLAEAGRLLARNSERHIKSPAEMLRLFADLPEAIANTELLSSRLKFTLEDLGYEFPKYPVPDGKSQMHFLRERTCEGMIRRYGPDNEKARKQIEHELALIEKLDLPGYFLIVWDIIRFCGENNILVQGRGSAANSAVCYALGITAVDPVGMELLFERFLSEERGEWPDIDLDLPSGDQRERAIQYVYERYGKLGAAMTANVITYRGRSAAREIGKALSFEPEMLDRLSSLVGAWEFKDEHDTLECHFREAGLDLNHHLIRKFLDLCTMVQDLPRHLGQHSGGMVVCQGQLNSVVPLEPATMPGRVVVQWDKDDCADMGIVKVDLLGLGMMAVLEDTLQIIRDDYKEEVDLAHLPANDRAVYSALQKADTIGMFQIESRAQMSCLPRLCPTCFYDIVVQVAIIRPGPIVGEMVNPYLKRRQGREPVDCLHPALEPVLKRTLGVPLFQEQLLRMAMIAAGFSGGEAEELRRALGFKRSEKRMKEVEKKLYVGMQKLGLSTEVQEKIVRSITSFALYGFPESHAASFALIAYASAWLKCHYLAAFTAAMLNNQPMGFYHPATLVKDAQRHGLRVKPIDITKSDWLCTLEQDRDRSLPAVQAGFSSGSLGGRSFSSDINSLPIEGTLAPEGISLEPSSSDLANQISAEGAAELSPGRKAWVGVEEDSSAVDAAQTHSASSGHGFSPAVNVQMDAASAAEVRTSLLAGNVSSSPDLASTIPVSSQSFPSARLSDGRDFSSGSPFRVPHPRVFGEGGTSVASKSSTENVKTPPHPAPAVGDSVITSDGFCVAVDPFSKTYLEPSSHDLAQNPAPEARHNLAQRGSAGSPQNKIPSAVGATQIKQFSMRLGLRYVKGLREKIAQQIVSERNSRSFLSIDDLKLRVPDIQKAELSALAAIGALNFIDEYRKTHRRDALWQIERAARDPGPLFADDFRSARLSAEHDFSSGSPFRVPHPRAFGEGGTSVASKSRTENVKTPPLSVADYSDEGKLITNSAVLLAAPLIIYPDETISAPVTPEGMSLKPPLPDLGDQISARGAAQPSPARKGWVTCEKSPSTVGAAQTANNMPLEPSSPDLAQNPAPEARHNLAQRGSAGSLLQNKIPSAVGAAQTTSGALSLQNPSPLAPMTTEERLIADYHGTGLTIGPHPLAHHRAVLKKWHLRTALEIQTLPNGIPVRIAGSVVVRQRPGTAKGFVFLSMEDETGIANVIITPQLFQQNRSVIVSHQFLLIEGILQNQDNVISVKAGVIEPLEITQAPTTSHDFH